MGRTAQPPIMTVNKARQALVNAGFTGPGGALNDADRGAYSYMPQYTGNPHDSNDYVFRWRQYVHLYETSWEARKIVRIIPEDALRKNWLVEDIPEEMAKSIGFHLDRLQFMNTLKRSLMLERLLGGCLTFMGLDSVKDEPEKPFHPKEGSVLRFCNSIPISRISRMSWDTNPLSEHYMRPNKYLINGEDIHVSRCLVWDGEPLFDPFDFALTNFRGNLAGFGPSKLAPVWDDIVKAVGTRQAAYQLIQTNNAILMAVKDLRDLSGTKSGQEALRKVKEIAQQLSVYNAAMIDGDGLEVKQHSASFGSVPELIMTFIQILSAASDIPATRFIGQAPGGLNATGESDLENYYNVIDAYQRQRIEPQLRRVYDVVGYAKFPQQWKREREKLTFKFPPLWNASELEEAQKNRTCIDNVMKLFESGLISEQKVIEEINAKGALSVELEESDISMVEETGLGGNGSEGIEGQQPSISLHQSGSQNLSETNSQNLSETNKKHLYVDRIPDGNGGWKYIYNSPQEAFSRLRNSVYFKNADQMGLLIKAAGGDPTKVDRKAFEKGFKVEQEHADTVNGNEVTIAKITLDHLAERADYYDLLEKVENTIVKSGSKYQVQSHSGKNLGEYDTKEEAEDRLKEVEYFKHQNAIDLDPLPQPSKRQAHAGNYKKHHLKLHGLDMAIENPQGSIRRGTDPNGVDWESELPAHYGYVKRTEGADGDHVDVYVGPHEESELVFVVDQNDLSTGKFDEHKCIFGALSTTQAKELYLKGFSDGKGESRLGHITPMHISQFKQWLTEGDTTKPYKG